MRTVCEGDCIDCVLGRPEDLPIAWNPGCQLWPCLYAAEYCDESCTCIKFPTRLCLENRPHMIGMCFPVPTLNIGTWDGLISLKERRNYGKEDKLGDF